MKVSHHLPPFPEGWFAVGFSVDLAVGEVLPRTFMGHEIVLFRAQSGEASAVDAYCPHMGAHFAHGGEVVGDALRCPFHGFCFDVKGRCVSTGYGTKPPPKAKLRVWPLREVHGILLVFYDEDGKPPLWEVPALDTEGWMPLLTHEWDLESHPQETTENSVDIGHLSVVHGYEALEMRSEFLTEGPYLNLRYAMKRPSKIGPFHLTVRSEFEIHVHGLGYSFVEVKAPDFGFEMRNFVLSCPVDGEQMKLRVAQSIKRFAHLPLALRLMPQTVLHRVIGEFVFKEFRGDVQQDFEIWQHKQYLNRPILAEGDGPVGKYRRWTRQFYPALRKAPSQSEMSLLL